MNRKHFFSGNKLACALVALTFAVPASLFAADKAKFEEGGIEYHFVLNDLMNINEGHLAKLPFCPISVSQQKIKCSHMPDMLRFNFLLFLELEQNI